MNTLDYLKVTEEEIENGIKDEFGAVYSADGKRLLKFENGDLKEYSIKEGTVYICHGAFEYSSLKKINIPDGVTHIGNEAFRRTKIKEIILPDSVQFIGKGAFDECGRLTNIEIPDNVTEIGEKSFNNAKKLLSVILSDSVIDYSFFKAFIISSSCRVLIHTMPAMLLFFKNIPLLFLYTLFLVACAIVYEVFM